MSSWTLCFTMKAFRDGRRIRGTSAAWRFFSYLLYGVRDLAFGLDTVSHLPPPPQILSLLHLFAKSFPQALF